GTVVTSAKSTAASSANAQAARNLATNSIGSTGKGVASTGSAVSTSAETMIPLSAVARFAQGATPLAVNHQGLLVANTISVNLPIGIVRTTAIMMIDFALAAERRRGLGPLDAIGEAWLLRFRPIMMTTMAAMLGAVPLAIGMGDGGELRQPLGIAIVGGLVLSQVLTLYSTPVIYLYLDRFRLWSQRLTGGGAAPHAPGPSLQPGE